MNNDLIYYGIPSYHKAHQSKTLDYLELCEIPKERILMSLQCDEDLQAYKEAGFDNRATVIYRKGENVADNRNTLLEYAEDKGINRLLMLDDDIKSLSVIVQKNGNRAQRIGIKNDMDVFITRLFDYCRRVNAPLFGFYPLTNDMMQNMRIKERSLLTGASLGFSDMSLRFDRNYPVKEDYELCLRLIDGKRKCVRFNFISAKADRYAQGGCHDVWNSNANKRVTEALLQRYIGLIKENPRRSGEILLID